MNCDYLHFVSEHIALTRIESNLQIFWLSHDDDDNDNNNIRWIFARCICQLL